MSYSGFKDDLLEFIHKQQLISSIDTRVFLFNNKDIHGMCDFSLSTKDASDALKSLWQNDGELARIEVSKIDKDLISDRESVPSKGYFYTLAQYAPPGFEMHEKFKLDEKKEIKPEINVVFTETEILETNNKETEMDNAEKEYVIAVWSREFEGAETYLYRALNNPTIEFSIDSFEGVEEYMSELRRLQDEYATRYRMAKKQLEALK